MIPSFLVTRFGPLGAKLVFFGGIALLLLLAALAIYLSGRSDGKTGEIVGQQKREIETQIDLGRAGEKAADARVKDATTAAKQEKELTDALNATKNPDRQRTLRGCAILRQQGRDTSNIPACR
jgi:hypothetical protein